MFGLSFAEIAVILALALVVLGPKRLPEIARTIGRGLREIRRASDEVRGVWEDVDAPPQRRRERRPPPDGPARLPAPGPAPGTVSAGSLEAGGEAGGDPAAHGAGSTAAPEADPSAERPAGRTGSTASADADPSEPAGDRSGGGGTPRGDA